MLACWVLGGMDLDWGATDSPYPGGPDQATLNYNLLEGRFKQLQGKTDRQAGRQGDTETDREGGQTVRQT